jgi:hypothetical protein
MMKPTTTPASPSSDELESRSSGKRLVRKPMKKMIEATKSEDSSDLVLLATRSLMVHTSMTMTKASTGFIGSLPGGADSGEAEPATSVSSVCATMLHPDRVSVDISSSVVRRGRLT